MGEVTAYVMEPDLWIVTVVVLGVGIVYFWRELSAKGNDVKSATGSDASDD